MQCMTMLRKRIHHLLLGMGMYILELYLMGHLFIKS